MDTEQLYECPYCKKAFYPSNEYGIRGCSDPKCVSSFKRYLSEIANAIFGFKK